MGRKRLNKQKKIEIKTNPNKTSSADVHQQIGIKICSQKTQKKIDRLCLMQLNTLILLIQLELDKTDAKLGH